MPPKQQKLRLLWKGETAVKGSFAVADLALSDEAAKDL